MFQALKSNFKKIFGSSYEENIENIDQKHWTQNLKQLLSGKDVDLGVKTGAKRARKSMNESLNESFLESFEQTSMESLDDVDELRRVKAENEILKDRLKAQQELFTKVRVGTSSRNNGGSVLKYGKRVKAYAISLLAAGESCQSVHRSLKCLSMVCLEFLEVEDGSVTSIPCRRTLDTWREQIPSLNNLQCSGGFSNSCFELAR